MQITKEELNYIFDNIKTLITGKTNEDFENSSNPISIFSKAGYQQQLLSMIDGTLIKIAARKSPDDEQLIIDLIRHLIFLLAVKAKFRRSANEK